MAGLYGQTFGYNFTFKTGQKEFGFSKISGLETQLELETISEGGLNGYAHMVPALRKQPVKLRLECGVGPPGGLDHLWVGRRLPGVSSVVIYQNTATAGRAGNQKYIARTYEVHDAVVTACRTGALDARSNAVLIDTLEMVCRRLTQVK